MSTQIRSELLLASKNKHNGVILYTFRLTYPRIILPENLTHRVGSRNTSSTRAIPTLKMIKTTIRDMFVPVYIGSAQKGMQAGAELTGWRRKATVAIWKSAGYAACLFAYLLYRLGVAKEIAGRLVEPFSWVTQIFSATDLDNFFKLRNNDMAEPHFHELASQMQKQVENTKRIFKTIGGKTQYQGESLDNRTPLRMQILEPGQWHLPLIRPDERLPLTEAKKVSAARCARTSYTLLDTGKESSIENDIALCDKLIASHHMSPSEHQAMATQSDKHWANFRGFRQYRKEIEGSV